MTRRVAPEDITEELLEAAAAGVSGAAGTLADFIYGWVEAILRGTPDVDDATQEAFLAVLHAVKCGSFKRDPNKKPSSWVVRVSVNKAIDVRRKQRRSLGMIDLDSDVDEVTGSGRELDHAVDLTSAVSSLTSEGRALLLLRHTEGLSEEEIAETLSIPVGTVKSRLSRLHAKLREILGTSGPAAKINSSQRGKA